MKAISPMYLFVCSLFLFVGCFGGVVPSASASDAPRGGYLDIITGGKIPKDEPITFEAERIKTGEGTDRCTTSLIGHVVIRYGPYVITTDQANYDRKTESICIDRHVLLSDSRGNRASADWVWLSPTTSEGIFKNVCLRSEKHGTALAEKLFISEDSLTASHVSYTTCFVCPGADRLWQVRAKKIMYDRVNKSITYKHIFLDFWGIPVLYFPYFKQNDVSVKRASGFLTPRFGHSRTFGSSVHLPFFWNIAPNTDATISPTFYTRENPLIDGKLRHLLNDGYYEARAGAVYTRYTSPGHARLRSYLLANGAYTLSQAWHSSFQINTASDPTVLTRYDIAPDKTVLINNFHFDQRKENQILDVDAFTFQSLQYPNDDASGAVVAPRVFYTRSWGSDQSRNGQSTLRLSAASLSRPYGTSTHRISSDISWVARIDLPAGHILRLSSQVRADLYGLTGPIIGSPQPKGGGARLMGRIIPTVGGEWHYPVFTTGLGLYHVFEAIAQVFASSYYGEKQDHIPNEDSLNVELDDTNLFAASRFPGFDRVEDGVRMNYGMLYTAHNKWGQNGSLLIGQSYRWVGRGDIFPIHSGLEEPLSDYVGRIGFSAGSFHIFDRFRLNQRSFSLRRHEIGIGLDKKLAGFSLSYSHFSDGPNIGLKERSEISLSGNLSFVRNWRIRGGATYDFKSKKVTSNTIGFVFRNECFHVEFSVVNRNVKRLDIRPDSTYILKVKLIGVNA